MYLSFFSLPSLLKNQGVIISSVFLRAFASNQAGHRTCTVYTPFDGKFHEPRAALAVVFS